MTIRLANTPAELAAIYRFRYRIYVEEMNRKQKHADHFNKQICDPLDGGSHVMGAWENDEIVGTIRINFLRETNIGEYFEMYQVGRLPLEVRQHTSIITRLMVASHLKGGTLGARLAMEMYQFGVERGITTGLMDCNPPLVPFFLALGFRMHYDGLVHPEYGAVSVMRLDCYDMAHFEQIRSPLLPKLRRILASKQKNCPEHTTTNYEY